MAVCVPYVDDLKDVIEKETVMEKERSTIQINHSSL